MRPGGYKEKEDVLERWCELEYETAREIWDAFRSGTPAQEWTVMPAKKFVKMVRRAHAGLPLSIEDKEQIDDWAELIFENYVKLCGNTILVGHDSLSPKDWLQDVDIEATSAEVEALCDWIADDAFSDYGLRPIGNMIVPMMLQSNYYLKMQIMTEIIGVTHCRGDLCKFFVQHGQETRFKLPEYEGADY